MSLPLLLIRSQLLSVTVSPVETSYPALHFSRLSSEASSAMETSPASERSPASTVPLTSRS